MSDDSDFLKFLEIIQNRIEHQHSVLWRVETHYTWLVYVIAGGLAYVFFEAPPNLQKLWIPLLGGLGIILSVLGYFVVRLEGEYLHENREIYKRTLGKLPHLKRLHPEQEQKAKFWENAKNDANKSFPLLLLSVFCNTILIVPIYLLTCRKTTGCVSNKINKLRLTVRDAFQVTLLIATILFIITILFTYVPVLQKIIA